MPHTTSATPLWSEASLKQYRATIAPSHRNLWNTIKDVVESDSFVVCVAFVLIVSLLLTMYFDSAGESLLKQRFAVTVALGIIAFLLFGPGIITGLSHPAPQWNKRSVLSMINAGDVVIPVNHPLRSSIVDIRKEYPEAEFCIETLVTSPPEKIPTHYILWVSKSPFTSAQEVVVLAV
jgi:hypothetical protein